MFANILLETGVEDDWLLTDYAQLRLQVADVVILYVDLTLLRVINPQQQWQDSRLAAPGSPNKAGPS